MTVLRLLSLLFVALSASMPFAALADDDRTATLIRDEWGVPHIFAETEEAGFFALGYATAEDRLERFVGLVLFSRGELASVLGPAMLETDVTNRLWRHREAAQAGLSQLSPELARNYRAFLAGLRARIDAAAKPELAAVVKQLEVVDLIAIARAILYAGYQVQAARAECRVDGMAYSRGFLPYRSSAEERGSNGWVVMPERTADRALILASDPHVDVDSVAYYEFHMQAGRLHSSGFALGPVLWQAHTERVAWAMTTGNPDYLDCYAIETLPGAPNAYLYDGERRAIEARTETFAVAGAEPVERALEYARVNGLVAPIVARRAGVAYAAVAADMDRAGTLHEEIYRMNLADDAVEVRDALSTSSMFPQNLVVGDAEGHVLYVRAGRVPVRPSGFDWTAPVPGNTSAAAWKGFRTLGDLLLVEDPPAGWLQNNNVAPDTMTTGLDRLSERYASDIFFDAPGRRTTRGMRASAVLAANERMTLDDAKKLAFDEMWITAPAWLDLLRASLAKWPNLAPKQGGAAAQAVERLRAFDGKATAESQAAADFYFWHAQAQKRLAKIKEHWLVDGPWSKERISRPFAAALVESLTASVEDRVKRYGTARQRLGDVMRVGRGGDDYPVGGVTLESNLAPLCLEQARPVCDRTMRAFGVVPHGEKGRFRVARGSQAMRLVQFTKPLKAFSLYAHGQSDDPASPHYADQAKLISERRMKPAYFSREELNGHVASQKTLRMP